MSHRRDEVHENVGADGLEVKKDPVENTAVEVLEGEALGENLKVNEEKEGGQLNGQGTQTRVALDFGHTAR